VAIWDGGGGDNNGSTAANWSGNIVPNTVDVAIFDLTSSKDAVLDATFPGTLAGLVVEDSYDGTITQNRDLALTTDFEIHEGTYVVPDPAVHNLTVGNVISHTGGILRQTQSVNAASVPFLTIDDGAANVKYRGIHLDTSGTGSNLGATTVEIRVVDTAADEYCTDVGPASPVYAERCFTITPTTNGAAAVRLWALTNELNDIAEGDLAVFRNISGGANWSELASTNGNDGGSYRYAEGTTPGFSDFLLGKSGNGPTAVTLYSQAVRTKSGDLLLVVAVAMVGALFLTLAWRQGRSA
jgi:hypothetical protein